MILIPNQNGCTFVTDTSFSMVSGSPHIIIEKLIRDEIKIDENTTVLLSTIKEISILDIMPFSIIYINLLKASGVEVKVLKSVKPEKLFKEEADGSSNRNR